MLVSLTRKEHSFQLLAEVPVVVKNLHNAVLDDVRHKRDVIIDFLPLSSEKWEMLHV